MNDFDASILDIPGTVLIDDRNSDGRGPTYVLAHPRDVLIARSPDEVLEVLGRINQCVRSGMFVAGYLGYEAGLALDKPISLRYDTPLPLAWFGVYADSLELDSGAVDLGEQGVPGDVRDMRLNISEDECLRCVGRIQGYIAAGDVYQVNFTCKLLFEHSKPARSLFARLRRAHPVGYSAFVNLGDAQIMSMSPELFLRRAGNCVLTRPMKGTVRRGRWSGEDAEMARYLAIDPKNRAENVMIVDLMRNDLGRVCVAGGVSVPRLFSVERYGSLFQMTSDVEGRLRDGTTVSDLLQAVFPPGSITGAPKIRAMEIIDELEREPRGVYCGSIGMFRPDGDLLLNVAIRTIVQRGNECEMGVGSGIVADSDPVDELRETQLKGAFLQSEPCVFDLLETLLYRHGEGYAFLDEHLARMRQSASYFGWCFPEAQVRDALAEVVPEIEERGGNARVRLLLSSDGACRTEWAAVEAQAEEPVSVLIASRRTDPSDVFLYHKTMHRHAYDDDWREARKQGYFDLLYLNVRDELTEGAITNVMVEIDGRWYTPPLGCGLLPGVWRADMMASGDVKERIMTADDLRRASRVILGNSVRGSVEVGRVAYGDGPAEVIFEAAGPSQLQ